MSMGQNPKRFLTGFSVLTMTACTVELTPDWETIFTTQKNQAHNIEWVKASTTDSNGDYIVAGTHVIAGQPRQEHGLVAKFDAFGNLVWHIQSQSHKTDIAFNNVDEALQDIVTDLDGNIYAVGHRRAYSGERPLLSSFVMKLNADGQQIWSTETSQFHDAHDIEISNNAIFVTGYSTHKISLDGNIQFSIPHAEKAWDVELNETGEIFVGSRYGVQHYSFEGEPVSEYARSKTEAESYSLRVNLELDDQGNAILLTPSLNGHTNTLEKISASGQLQWTRSLEKKEGFTIQGKPQLIASSKQLLVAVSDLNQRAVFALNQNGKNLWQFSDDTGPIQDMAKLSNGQLIITGAGHSGVLNSNGELIATHNTSLAGDVTTGSIMTFNDSALISTSVVTAEDGIGIHLAKFSQPN